MKTRKCSSTGSPSHQLPMRPGSTTWTDWDELETDVNAAGGTFDLNLFRLLDEISAQGTSDSCTIDPDDGTELCGELTILATFDSLPLADGYDSIRAVCLPATTNTGSYTKQLTVSGGINP